MVKQNNKTSYVYISLVAIVAIVALIISIGGSSKIASDKSNNVEIIDNSNLAGQTFSSNQIKTIYYIDEATGNQIKISQANLIIRGQTGTITCTQTCPEGCSPTGCKPTGSQCSNPSCNDGYCGGALGSCTKSITATIDFENK